MKLTKLGSIAAGTTTAIEDLSEDQLEELQTALTRLGYPLGDIDGLYGPRTRNAWAEYVDDFGLGDPLNIDNDDVVKLKQALDNITPTGNHDLSTIPGTKDAIISECTSQGLGLKAQLAYVLATVDHETAHTFKPVREAFWLKNPDAYLKKHHKYYPYYGRGYVQLTWKDNYAKYGKLLGLDLVGKPDLALEPETALFVLVHGFKTGVFTGRKLIDYVNTHEADFLNARRCINGKNKAKNIAKIAEDYLAKL